MSKDFTEDFWNDCTSNQISTHIENNNPYKKFSKIYGRNNYSRKIKNPNKNIMNIYSFQNPYKKTKNSQEKNKYKSKTNNENPNFSKIYKQHPLLHQTNIYSQEDKISKKRQKNAYFQSSEHTRETSGGTLKKILGAPQTGTLRRGGTAGADTLRRSRTEYPLPVCL